ncbi:MAG: alanine dehydrogenase, partial [Gillisia sp.]|nr:alanine dehydrogenase [Gillisia sp.]
MSKQTSPFTREQLLPQEETLEVYKNKGELFIGIPKETSFQEKRVCLTPDAVGAITAHGHRVMIESNAGKWARFSDKDYSDAGAEVTKDTKKVFSCPTILKIEPPSISELEMINSQSTLISALQLKTQCKEYFQKLAAKRITALAFEFIKDEDGS